MPIYKRIDEIDKAYLQSLVEDEVLEDRGIEYKRDLNILKDLPNRELSEAKRKFCGEISAFANTDGGYLIFGIADDKGAPQKEGLCGIDKPDDFDQLKLKIQGIIDKGIEPQLFGVDMAQVEIEEEKIALLIYIPPSWSKPHWVGEKGCRTFYTRTSGGKDHLDIRNVRELFVLSEAAGERIREFRDSRISKIVSGEFPIVLCPGPVLVLHVVPFSAVTSTTQFDLARLKQMHSNGGMRQYFGLSYNFDGVYEGPLGQEGSRFYQIFRNGSLEFTSNLLQEIEREIFAPDIGYLLSEEFLPRISEWHGTLNVPAPLFYLLSILHVRNLQVTTNVRTGRRLFPAKIDPSEIRPISDRDNLKMTEIQIDTRDQDVAKVMRFLRPAIDAAWQASGWPEAGGYDKKGNWLGIKKH